MKFITLAIVSLVYLVQGIGIAYIGNVYKPLLHEYNVDAVFQGVAASLMLIPFILKLPIAYVTDKYSGTLPRISVIRISAACGFLASVFLGLFHSSGPELLSLFLFSLSLCIAIADVGADGLAVETASKTKVGDIVQMQAMMFSARAIGIFSGTLVFTMLMDIQYSRFCALLYMLVFMSILLVSYSYNSSKLSYYEKVTQNFTVSNRNTYFYNLILISISGMLIFTIWGAVELVFPSQETDLTGPEKDHFASLSSFLRTLGIVLATFFSFQYAEKFRDLTAMISSLFLFGVTFFIFEPGNKFFFILAQFGYGFSMAIIFVWLTSTLVQNINPRLGAFYFTLVATVCNLGFILSPTIFGLAKSMYGVSSLPSLTSIISIILFGFIYFFFYRKKLLKSDIASNSIIKP
jgi:MFS family permease